VGRAREYDVISHWLFSRAPVDYIFFIQKDVTVHPNPIEVKSFRYLTQPELRHFMDSAGVCGSFDVFPTRERVFCYHLMPHCSSVSWAVSISPVMHPDAQGLPVTPWFRLIVNKYASSSVFMFLHPSQLPVRMVGQAVCVAH
jgi:isopentenyldiphosphate isomerase